MLECSVSLEFHENSDPSQACFSFSPTWPTLPLPVPPRRSELCVSGRRPSSWEHCFHAGVSSSERRLQAAVPQRNHVFATPGRVNAAFRFLVAGFSTGLSQNEATTPKYSLASGDLQQSLVSSTLSGHDSWNNDSVTLSSVTLGSGK